MLTPGNYVALNLTGNGAPASAPFTVTQSGSPAALPPAKATQTTVDFSFRGPKVLHAGTIVRAQNGGDEAHMIVLMGARNRAAAGKLLALLRHGASQKKAAPYLNGQFIGLLGTASPGALQQTVLKAKPGYHVEACFMDTRTAASTPSLAWSGSFA